MNAMSFVYVDENNLVTYALDRDNANNRYCTKWRRYEMPSVNVVKFMRYWGLKFHPLTLKNVVKTNR